MAPIYSDPVDERIQVAPWQALRVDVPLSSRPVLVASGIGVHGLRGPEQYRLPELWCLHLYRYETTLIINGLHELPIRANYASVIPPDAHLEYRFKGRSVHFFAHFRFDQEPNPDERTVAVPVMQDLSDDFGRLFEYVGPLAKATRYHGARSDARLWDALWQLAEVGTRGAESDEPTSPIVKSAIRTIELRLDQTLRVGEVAEEVGVSLGYLSQLFQQEYGMTVIGYLRHRRMARAKHLLTQSTLPIKSIAAMVGLSDLQQFNKLVHRELGVAPRQLRIAYRAGDDGGRRSD